MPKDDSKKSKSHNEGAPKPSPSKPKGRGFCASMFIYTFVFVSGVVVATVLPDLVGHHFKQPYGKEYGAIAEQVFKDLPKHLTTFRDTVVLLGRDVVDRVWNLKAQFEGQGSGKNEKSKAKPSTDRPKARAHGSN